MPYEAFPGGVSCRTGGLESYEIRKHPTFEDAFGRGGGRAKGGPLDTTVRSAELADVVSKYDDDLFRRLDALNAADQGP